MHRYRAALIGCGRIGTLWETTPPTPLTHAGAFAVLPQTHLVAGASRGTKHLHYFGQQWGIDALYLDYRELFAREQIDVIGIATHPGLHRPIIEAALAAGVKGILCEKPLALNLEDADAIVAACAAAGCTLAVNHSRRWDPAHRQAKALIEAGEIGEVVALFGICQGIKPYPAWVADEEGPLLHDAVHLFDLFRWFGGDPVSVVGTAVRHRHHEFRVEDDSHAIFTFPSGISGVAMVNELTRYARFELQIQGTDGVIILGSEGNRWLRGVDITDQSAEPDPQMEWQQLQPAPWPEPSGEGGILATMRDLIECMESGATPNSSGIDGIASLEMAMGVYSSQLAQNTPVQFPLVDRTSQLYQLREAGLY